MGLAGSGPSAIFRTTSHSGSVSLAYLTQHHHSANALGSSNSNAPSHAESSAGSRDINFNSAELNQLVVAPGPNGSSPGHIESVEREISSGDEPSSSRSHRGLSPSVALGAGLGEHMLGRQPSSGDAGSIEERGPADAGRTVPTMTRVLGTVFEGSDSHEVTETRDNTSSSQQTISREDAELDAAGMTKPLDQFTASLLEDDGDTASLPSGGGSSGGASKTGLLAGFATAGSDLIALRSSSLESSGAEEALPQERRTYMPQPQDHSPAYQLQEESGRPTSALPAGDSLPPQRQIGSSGSARASGSSASARHV
jgi:hypothetical protein